MHRLADSSQSTQLAITGIVGGAGYWYFGSTASELITTDLALKAPFSGRSLLIKGITVDRIVAASVLVNAYTTYPCLVLVIQACQPACTLLALHGTCQEHHHAIALLSHFQCNLSSAGHQLKVCMMQQLLVSA